MFNLKCISSGAPWEEVFGYSRAVRYNNVIEFSGTVSPEEFPGDEYDQTQAILETIEKYLIAEGGARNNIVRTRVYCLHIDHWEEIARAHSEFFDSHRPATSLIQISGLIDPKYLIEIEATAVLAEKLST